MFQVYEIPTFKYTFKQISRLIPKAYNLMPSWIKYTSEQASK